MDEKKIRTYYGAMLPDHHRYRSWEHCFQYFQRITPVGLSDDRDFAALHVAFYLASWGMYRGSSFLLQYAYTVHLGLIDLIRKPYYSKLWDHEFGLSKDDGALIPIIVELIDSIREVYRPFAQSADHKHVSDTLISKIILGTFGCSPACDRFFVIGVRKSGLHYSKLNRGFLEQVLEFCQTNMRALKQEQAYIRAAGGVHYPLMKLIDMYFWQIGFELSAANDDAMPRLR